MLRIRRGPWRVASESDGAGSGKGGRGLRGDAPAAASAARCGGAVGSLSSSGWGSPPESPKSGSGDTICKKYFTPNWGFLVGREKETFLHTWRAILEGRKALEMGLIKRMGDGSTTDMWNDRWIPGTYNPLCKNLQAGSRRVCELMTSDGLEWDVDAINRNLIAPDANAVCCIPLGKNADVWAWAYEKHEIYLVRSPYHLLADEAWNKERLEKNVAAA